MVASASLLRREKRMEVAQASSPNFGPRRGGVLPSLVVLHYTAMETAEAALERLCDPVAEVSAHYLIAEGGTVWRLVAEVERAWHAGAGSWRGVDDVNSHSIGIELANAGPPADFPPFPEPQMAALEILLDEILARWSIPAARVIAHSDIAPGRKADPGPKFDWRRLALGGRASWAEGVAPECGWEAFRLAASAAGYAAPADDWHPVLAAFRLRFRPWAKATAPEHADVGALRALAAAD
jgi:N-acetylmuramoyl-L-alanine amidase